MPDASDKPVPTSVTITLNMGRTSVRIATIPVSENESTAMASVIANAVRLIVDEWPHTVYLPQLKNLARSLCKNNQQIK